MYKELRSLIINNGPALCSRPLRYVPFALKKQVIEQLLRLQFKQTLAAGELNFLTDRWLKIDVRDLSLSWFITLVDGKLKVSQDEIADVSFSGETNDLILIATRRQDPDTLFFQRRLVIEGDTELGLQIKNMMDAFDLDSMPKIWRTLLERMADLIENDKEAVISYPPQSL